MQTSTNPPPPHLLLFMLISGLFVSDILYGGLDYFGIITPKATVSLTPGVIIRGALLLFALIQVVWYMHKLPTAWIGLLLMLMTFTLPGIIVSTMSVYSFATLFRELVVVSKVLFGPVMMLWFVLLIKKWNLSSEILLKHVEYSFYFIGMALLLMRLTDLNVATYAYTDVAHKGIFWSQNDFSLCLGIGMVASVMNNLMRYSSVRVVLMLCSIFSFINIGTRASLLFATSIPVFVLIMLTFSKNDNWKRRNVFRMLIFMGPLFVIVAMYMGYATYQNALEERYLAQKYSHIIDGNLPRDALLEAGNKYLKGRNALFNLFGEGSLRYGAGVNYYWRGRTLLEMKGRSTEVDWMDIFGQYGLFFTLLLHTLFIFILSLGMIQWLKYRDPTHGAGSIMLALYLGNSALAGHALVSAIPSGLIAVVCAMILTTYKGKKHHITYLPRS